MAPKSRKAKPAEKAHEKEDVSMEAADMDVGPLKETKSGEDEAMGLDQSEDSAGYPAPQAECLKRTSSASNYASTGVHSDRRIQGAAMTLGGTAGMLIGGPVSGAALGAAALYATTREDAAGSAARKAGKLYLQAADKATDEGVKALDIGVKKLGEAADAGARRLSETSSVPAPIRSCMQNLATRQDDSTREDFTALALEAQKMRAKFPNSVLVLCERSAYSSLPTIAKNKFTVPGSMRAGEFKYLIHKQIAELSGGQRVDQTIYLFVNGCTLKTSTTMLDLFHQHVSEDGFLHVTYTAENTLGSTSARCKR